MNPYEELQRRRKILQGQIDEIDALLRQHDEFAKRAKLILGIDTRTETDLPQHVGTVDRESHKYGHPARANRSRPPSNDVVEFEQTVTDILSNAGEPLDRTALLDLVTQRGISVGGQDPKNTLGARMSRMESATNVRGRGYWLKSRLAEIETNDKENVQDQVSAVTSKILKDLGLQ